MPRAEPLHRVERCAEMWSRGYAGEQTVGAQLELLRPLGFEVLHDVRWPGRKRANIDHVAIGPPGILVVDAKNWSGNVTVRNGVLRQNGYKRDRAVDGARQAGQDVAALLQLPWALHVIPVIALAAQESTGIHQRQGVTVVGQRDLVAWATGLPGHLTPGDAQGTAAHLRAALPSASLPAPRGSRRPSSRGAPREPSARERKRAARRAARRRETLARLTIVLLLLVLGPSLFAWWSSHGEDVVRSVVPTPTFSAAAPTTAAKTAVFTNCAELRATYPSGVKRAGATNSGKTNRGKPVVDGKVFRANAGLDRDGDGIACERKKGTGRKKG